MVRSMKRTYLVSLVSFLAGAWMVTADEVFYWYGSLGRNYYWWPFGIKTDIWLAWIICWSAIAVCFGVLAALALRPVRED